MMQKAKDDEVANAERDKVHGVVNAESDKVVENDKVPQVCALKADVEQVTEAPPQQQQHSSDVAAVNEPESAAGPSDAKQRSNALLSKLSTCKTKNHERSPTKCSNALMSQLLTEDWISHRST